MVIGASAKVELAKREWIPDPSVSLQAQHYDAGRQAISEINAGLSIDLPWFNSKKYRAGEREAQSDLLAAQQSLEGAQTEAIGMLRDQLQKIETMQNGRRCRCRLLYLYDASVGAFQRSGQVSD